MRFKMIGSFQSSLIFKKKKEKKKKGKKGRSQAIILV